MNARLSSGALLNKDYNANPLFKQGSAGTSLLGQILKELFHIV